MSGQFIVETEDLTKAYDGTTVVDRVNLHVAEGAIYGFLGPNGAGKTTTILMLLGLTEPTSGVVRVYGYNSTREPLKVKRITGYIPEKVGFYEDLTASQNLAYTARLNGLAEWLIPDRIGESLDTVGLPTVAEQRVGEFSRGMKQRLAIADMLVKMPKVAILDEPTLGIDPEGINQILDLISRIAREHEMTIIMSSHQLNQVQRICSRVGIIKGGQMLVEDSLERLIAEAFGGGRCRIEVQLAEISAEIVDGIKQIEGVVGVERSGDLLLVGCEKDLRPQIAKAIVAGNGSLVEMKIKSYTLEDIYLKYFREV